MWMGTRVMAVVKRRRRWPGRRDGQPRSMGQGGSRREFVNRPRNPNDAARSGVRRSSRVVSLVSHNIILLPYIVHYRYPTTTTTTHPSIVGEEWQFIILSYSLDFYFLHAIVSPATYQLAQRPAVVQFIQTYINIVSIQYNIPNYNIITQYRRFGWRLWRTITGRVENNTII